MFFSAFPALLILREFSYIHHRHSLCSVCRSVCSDRLVCKTIKIIFIVIIAIIFCYLISLVSWFVL